MLLSLTLAATIAIPGMLIRWVFLQRPVNWFTALAIAAPIWLLLLWGYHVSGGEDQAPPAFISLGGIFLFMALVAPLKKQRTFPPRLPSPESPPIIMPEAIPPPPPEIMTPYEIARAKEVAQFMKEREGGQSTPLQKSIHRVFGVLIVLTFLLGVIQNAPLVATGLVFVEFGMLFYLSSEAQSYKPPPKL